MFSFTLKKQISMNVAATFNVSNKDALLILSTYTYLLAEESETNCNERGEVVNMAIKFSPYCCYF